jgi:hypothetical protein
LIGVHPRLKTFFSSFSDARLTMKPEYDFSKGQRGKFFRPDTELRLPIYLDADVQRYLAERAMGKGVSLGEMVNDLLKREIQIIESVK